jgi:predicted NUDIX family NTP pyrophosphohydrolase
VSPPRSSHRSAGIVLYRPRAKEDETELEVLLVHPGGPFWTRRDAGAWSIPKGEYAPGDDPFEAARREFEEELGAAPPDGRAHHLGEINQKGGKLVCAWAIEGDLDASGIKSNTFTVEWPPRSGRMRPFPEVDRAEWFTIEAAKEKINPGQAALLDRLAERVG